LGFLLFFFSCFGNPKKKAGPFSHSYHCILFALFGFFFCFLLFVLFHREKKEKKGATKKFIIENINKKAFRPSLLIVRCGGH
jgi:uncharacterized membrane protein YfcA